MQLQNDKGIHHEGLHRSFREKLIVYAKKGNVIDWLTYLVAFCELMNKCIHSCN